MGFGNLNKVILIGRLVRDPKEKRTKKDHLQCSFTLAVQKEGVITEGVAEASFFTVIVYGKMAEIVIKFVSKGHKVAVEGSLEQVQNFKKDNNDKDFVYVKANKVEFLNPKKNVESTNEVKKKSYEDSALDDNDDENVPF